MASKRETILAMMGKDAQHQDEYLAEFKPPSTYQAPDEAKDGREFEVMVSAKVKPDGTLCITKIGGIEADEEGGEETEEVEMMEEEAPMPPPTMNPKQMQGMV